MNNKISQSAKDKIIKLIRMGKSQSYITKHIGVTIATVKQVKHEMGISKYHKLLNQVFCGD